MYVIVLFNSKSLLKLKELRKTYNGELVPNFDYYSLMTNSLIKLPKLIVQSLHPAVDTFLVQSSKLESQIRSTVQVFSAFLDTFQQLACRAANTRGKKIAEDENIDFLKLICQDQAET